MQFSVRVPQKENPQHMKSVVVEARDSLSALRMGLEQLHDSIDMSAMICDFSDPDSLRVTDPTTNRIIVITEYDPTTDQSASSTMPDESPKSALPVTEDLPAIEDLPETREMPAALSAQESIPSFPADESTEADTNAKALDTQNDEDDASDAAGKTELYIPAFSMEQALQLKNQHHNPAHFLESTPVGSPPSETADDLPMDEATMMESGFVPSTGSMTMLETPAIPDSQAELPAAAPVVVIQQPVPPPAVPQASQPGAIQIGQPAPAQASPGRQTLSIRSLTGAEGQYKPGMTTETLANVFMRAMDIYDHPNVSDAMKFVLELGITDIPAMGGCVLLTDINSPEQILWFERVIGPKSEIIQNFQIPLGQGIIGYCAQQGVSQNIADVAHEPRFHTDVLSRVGLALGSILCVPIQNQKRVYGAIVFYNPPGERPFTQGELSILSYLAHVAGEYLSQQ